MDIMEGELTQRTKRTLQEAHEDAHKKTMEEISNKGIRYNVRYTKLISISTLLNKPQIKELIDDPSVQLITIEKV